MKLILDKYAHLSSPIHRWETRSKLVALLALIFAFALVQKLVLLPAMLLVTAVLYGLSRLPFSFLLTRLRYPGFFILAVVFFLPLVSGETVIFSWGLFKVRQEGCLLVLLILTRFLCIMTVSIVLFGTAPFLTSIKSMRSLGLPPLIVDMMLLAYRYLAELGETITTMQRAMFLRGFQTHVFSRRNLEVWASLTGSLLVRSYDQSRKVYQAMILRGYGQKINSHHDHGQGKINLFSWIASSITLIVAGGLLVAEIIS